ncbi:aldehyde dehydrogenase family protein, partial [Galactobacter sp.]|uniref:aldehyde dehydrogenase family protein n=1 Tax=Galactobacter sp. TaxID=2676125 RepID=UPI0025C68365
MASNEIPTIGHWIDGAVVESGSGKSSPVFNPATGEQIASLGLADQAEIDRAVASAQAGFQVWSKLSIAKR